MTASACVLCDRAAGLDAADPGWLLRTDCWGVSMHPAMPVPGWVAVQTMRHTEGFADLNRSEAEELGPLLSAVSEAVTRVTGSQRVYTYSLGEGCPHTHVLVGPPSCGDCAAGRSSPRCSAATRPWRTRQRPNKPLSNWPATLSSQYSNTKGDIK